MNNPRLLYYGSPDPLPKRVPLRAGPLTMVFENGDLRYVRLGRQLVLLRAYWAVRDEDWGTAAMRITDERIDARDDAFDITYSAVCTSDKHGIDFRAEVRIAGGADGSLTLALDGRAQAAFRRNRIGFCVLHPADQAGATVEITHDDGSREIARLPRLIYGRQPLLPFEELRALRVHLRGGAIASIRFAGDIFEMEDQRNWTDASFKTFCTPLRLPYPVDVPSGTRIAQSVALTLENAPLSAGRAARAAAAAFSVGTASTALPGIGFGQAYGGPLLSAKQAARMKALRPSHLRVDLDLSGANVERELRRAAKDAAMIGAALEAAVIVNAERAAAQLAALRSVVDGVGPKVGRWLIYPDRERQTEAAPIERLVQAAREALGSYNRRALFASGTDADFIFANKQPQAYRGIDAFCTCTNPQVHAFDNASLTEALAVQAVMVKTAAKIARGAPVFITPVTLKMRTNPYSVGGAVRGVPFSDPRQASLFGAGWTLGSIKYLAEAGAAGVTYYETLGERGVMGAQPYPMYFVFADVGEFAGGDVVISKSSAPLTVDGLVLRKGRRSRALLANFTDQSQAVRLRGAGPKARLKVLDAGNAGAAMARPEAWRAERSAPLSGDGITLAPYAIARVDW